MEEGQEYREKLPFNDGDATALENWIMASSRVVPVEGEEELVSQDNLLDIYKKDPHALKTPINLLTGERDLEQVAKIRQERKVLTGMFLTLFGASRFLEWDSQGVKAGIKLSEMNEKGEIDEIRVILTKDGQEIEQIDDYVQGLALDEGYKGILKDPQAAGGEIVCGFK